MADIALLVVEEFERRKNMEKAHRIDGVKKTPEEIRPFRLAASSALSSLGGRLMEEVSFLKAQVAAPPPPDSSFALAAFDGFFSA